MPLAEQPPRGVAVLTSLILSLVQVSGIREDLRQMRTEFHSDLTNRIEERMEHK